MGCPNCGNRDLNKAEPRIRYDKRRTPPRPGDGATFLGYRCLVCGHQWNAPPATTLVEFDVTSGPGYWMNETSGVLRPAVESYLHNKQMSATEIAALRAYLRQWVTSPVWGQNPHATETDRELLAELRHGVDRLLTREALDLWLYEAVAIGIDPV